MADNLSGLPSSAPPEIASLAAGLRAFVVWIGGSLAGISAIFYATGYLITRAHLSMLGLYGVIDFDNDHIIQEGGKFFLVVGYATVSNVALPLLAVFGTVVIAAQVIRLLAGSRAQRWWGRAGAVLPGASAAGWKRLLVFAALFAAFLWHSEIFLAKFQNPLCIGNLLYAEPGTAPCPASMMRRGANVLRTALLGRDEAVLNSAFQELVAGFALSAALAYLTWRATLSWRWRSWYPVPSLIATVLYLVLLPMDYGVLQRPVIYPRIVLTLDDKKTPPVPGRLFLLRQTASDFVVWDASVRKLFWIPAGNVHGVQVDGSYHLFGPAQSQIVNRGAKK